MKKLWRLALIAGFAVQPAVAQEAGEVVYQQACAACHEGGDPRAPTLQVLQSMSASALHYSLTSGAMAIQGQNLGEARRDAVVEFLAQSAPDDSWWQAARCSQEHRSVSLDTVSLASAGGDLQFSRQLSAEQSGLSGADFGSLELAWAFGVPGVSGLRSSPVVTGDTVIYPAAASGLMLALDVTTGCVKWAYDAGAALRSSVTLSDKLDDDSYLLFVSDERARLHAVNPDDGTLRWRVDGSVDEDVHTRLTGAPLYFSGRVFVPVSASGVQRAADPSHECCDGRGAVLALDALTGERLWTYLTMPAAEYTGELSRVGTRLRGPSGAPIWSSPGLDTKRRQLYVTTGENTSLPATETSNAIIALDMDTGAVRWQFQAIANDVWNMACSGREPGPNCPPPSESIIKDWDFGGAAVLVELDDGTERLVAGQKSGHLWALDPDNGELVWMQRVGEGGALGGNHWGIAIDGPRVVMTINDPNTGGRPGSEIFAGVHVFDIKTGAPLWHYLSAPSCAPERAARVSGCEGRYGFSALPLVIDGTIVAGSIDGRLFMFAGDDGRILQEIDTAHPYNTVNGVEARGGSIDAHSLSAGAGMVFVGSGYDRFRQQTGNVLLAFRPARR